MKLKSIITAVLLVAIVSTFIGCFDIAKTDVDTEQELLEILGESEGSSSGEFSNDVVVYFDDDPDKFLEVVKVKTDDENIPNNSNVADTKSDNSDADNNKNVIPKENISDELSTNSQVENESAGMSVSDNPGGNTKSENNSSGNSSSGNTIVSSNTASSSGSINSNQVTYVLNTNTKKFHYKSCGSASQIKPKNYAEATGRDSIIASGYEPCKRCNP